MLSDAEPVSAGVLLPCALPDCPASGEPAFAGTPPVVFLALPIFFNATRLPAALNTHWNTRPLIVISPVWPFSAAAPIITSPVI